MCFLSFDKIIIKISLQKLYILTTIIVLLGIYHMNSNSTRYNLKKIIAFGIVFLFILTTASHALSSDTYISSEKEEMEIENVQTVIDEQELHLLRGEHYLYVNATENVDEFHIRFVFPPDYGYQVPIYLEIYNDTTANISQYQIEDDTDGLNKLIKFTIDPMAENESALIHFSCWVLVKNHDFSDLPKEQKFPRRLKLPEETKTWLKRTKVVQKNSPLIRFKARQLRGIKNDMIRFAGRVAPFIKLHRYFLFLIQLRFGIFLSQDARKTLFINGENVGRSHLACALFRSQRIPARVLLAHNDQGFWTQMHYMVEYYVPDYGWVLLDSTKGKTPYETKRQIINRICFPGDEQDTKADYILPYMKGEERWLWIDTNDVYPYYVDCDRGSKSQMFIESEILTDSYKADYSFLLTQIVFHQYEQYLGMNLSSENQQHFENATMYQKQAMEELIETEDPNDYIYYMDSAFDEYKEIDV